MRKNTIIMGMALFFTLVLFSSSFGAEELTITTYYPSPYGSYNELQAGTIKIGDSDENTIKFYGTTGDNPGDYSHTVIAERLYGAADESELLLFKGNDPVACSGCQDRIRIDTPGYILFQTGNGYRTYDDGGGTDRMIITSDGNVGIGTADPGAKLHVANYTLDNTYFQPLIKITANENAESPSGTFIIDKPSYGIQFRRQWNSGEEKPQAGIYAWGTPSFGSGLAFTTAGSGTPMTTKMVIADTGNVGIGTAAPKAKLNIVGTILSTDYVAPSNSLPGIEIGYVGPDIDGGIIQAFDRGAAYVAKPLVLQPSGGNVGIGTLSPSATLEVGGQVKITGGTPGAGKVLTSDATGLATWVSSGTGAYVGYTPGTFNGGEVGGYFGGDAKCNSAFAGSRMCRANDFQNGTPNTYGWYNTYAWALGPGNRYINDCGGWQMHEWDPPWPSYAGPYWRADLGTSGSPGYRDCEFSAPILCCS